MTAVEPTPNAPGPASPPPERRDRAGFHVPTWVAVVVTVLVLAAIGFGIGYAVSDHHHDGRPGPFGGRFADGGGGHPGARILAVLFLLAIVALVVVGIVAAVRALSHRAPYDGTAGSTARSVSPTANAEQILAERLARGEIDADEYRTRLDALRR